MEEDDFPANLGQGREGREQGLPDLVSLRALRGANPVRDIVGEFEWRLTPATAPARERSRVAANDLPEPGAEALGLTAVLQVRHRVDKPILTRILGHGDIPDDGERSRAAPREVALHQRTRRGPVTRSRLGDELGIRGIRRHYIHGARSPGSVESPETTAGRGRISFDGMPTLIRLALTAAIWLGCSRPAPVTQADREGALRALFEADQADRSGPIEQVDMDTLNARDRVRRDSLSALIRAGVLGSASSYYHAAMLMQHGFDSADFRQANEWAKKSEELDSTKVETRWLVAASWDRYQMSRGEPQWYGTQSDRVEGGKGALVLYTIDPTRVTDRERIYRGVGTIDQLCARLNAINKQLKLKSPGCVRR